jgi:FKBP-type peptidyl-prolyl cis-trans isomerase (trigger factor)
MRPVAIKNVTASLLLGKVADVEKITVSEEDIDKRLDNMILGVAEDKKAGMRQLFDNPQTRDSMRQSLLARKTIERMSAIAKNTQENKKEPKEEEK